MRESLHTAMLTAIYGSELASTATYSNASGYDFSLSVVFKRSTNIELAAADIGVRDSAISARVRISELAQPKKNDILHIGDDSYRVDGYEMVNGLEWRLDLLEYVSV